MPNSRLRLALEKLTSGNWERFETFASEFLVVEMPDLRTVAAPSGDGGRDSELFSPAGDPTQVLQYSVTQYWREKLRRTAARISETIPTAQVLIYVTNQVIGAHADDIRRELRSEKHLHLDIRDRSYFLERFRRDVRTEAAAESLAKDIVDPYLAKEGIIRRSPVLESHEAKAAHVYLSLQLRDEIQEKGLTRLSFEALVRSVLINTTSEHRMKRAAVKAGVRQLLPNDPPDRLDQLTDSALTRLTKRAVRSWPQYDEFCLAYEETERLAEYLASQELSESALAEEIREVVKLVSPARGDAPPDIDASALRLRRILERCLSQRAESFASAVVLGNPSAFATDHLHQVVLDDLRERPAQKGNAEADPAWLESLVRELLIRPGDAIRVYLRDLADAYTLMAFLRQTPDVQSAVSKIFSHGEIWLDTSVILPLFAEELLEGDVRQFQQIVRIATEAGLLFHVTSGVLEELDRHIERCLACCRNAGTAAGRLPFLLEAFLQAGRDIGGFSQWVEQFRGPNRPLDDIREYLEETLCITVDELDVAAAQANDELRHAVEESWYKIHRARREQAGNFDPIAVSRLSKHDSESYVGVVQRRNQEKPSPFGYSAWWLTFDRSAHKIGDMIRQDFGVFPPDSPLISLDFLSQYLTLGPIRPRVSKDAMRTLPLVIEPHLVRFLTPELIAEATRIRQEMNDIPERVTQRRVRDHLDSARRRMGPLSQKGGDLFFEEVKT
jgi:hypothetical protein